MRVKDVMTHDVQRIHRNAGIQEAAEQMKTLDVGMLPVYDGDLLVGTLTDRDITIRGIAEKRIPSRTKVSDVMSPGVTYCFQDQDVEEAAKIMAEKQVRRLVILNRDKRLVGIVSLSDIATAANAKQVATSALEKVSQPRS